MRYLAKTSQEETALEQANRKTALQAALEGMVLLENDGTLPFKGVKKIALFGSGARKTVKGGTGSGDVNERSYVTVEDGLRRAGFCIVTDSWLERYDRCWERDRVLWKRQLEEKAIEEEKPFVIAYLQTLHLLPTMGIEKADMREADAAVYVIARRSGEGIDRVVQKGDYELSDEELEGLQMLKETYPKLIVVLNVGGPVDTVKLKELVKPSALLVMSQAGMEGGTALAQILTGAATPCGKLTDTWANSYWDYPEADNFSIYSKNPHEIFYREGIYVGYRYFATTGKAVSYTFGYGKSYTDFSIEYEGCRIKDGKIAITCSVKNSGSYPGKEVIQIYAKAPRGILAKSSRVLVGFVKTDLLNSGEKKSYEIGCELSALSSYDENTSREIIERGDYGFYMGNSLGDARPIVRFTMENDLILHTLKSCFHCSKPLKEWEFTESEQSDVFLEHITVDDSMANQMLSDFSKCEKVYSKYDLPEEDVECVKGLSNRQLIDLVVGAADESRRSEVGNAATSVPGAAGQTTGCIENIPSLVLADGGSGLRLIHHFQTDKKGTLLEQDGMAGLERGAFVKPTAPQENAVDYYQYCTAFPIGTMIAQTWNEEICKEIGAAVGKEMEMFGVQIWLAPSINIHRNPLCGRNFEYYSEDPYLTGKLASAVCMGVAQNSHAAVTIKHFAANNQELCRHSSDSIVSERALREIYLKPFELVIKAVHPYAIMTSYNCINGIQAANNYDLCTRVARDEWGFDGLIMTDWGTTDPGESVPEVCIQCGNDLIMPGGRKDKERLKTAVQAGKLEREKLELAASNILSVARRLQK